MSIVFAVRLLAPAAVAISGQRGHGDVVDAGDVDLAALVRSAQRGSRSSFAALYDRFHRVVHAVALARVEPSDAADVVQEVFIEAWLKVGTLREAAAFPGWLLAMARNRATDQQRAMRRHPRASERDRPPDTAIDPPPRAEAIAALEAIRALPETYSETLIMRLVEGLSGPEIAERTGMTPDSVRVNLHRGMILLRRKLGGQGDGT